MLIIGLTGQACCGKGVASDVLESSGFRIETISSVIKEIARKRGLPVTRKNLQFLGDEARSLFGPGILVEWLIEKAENEGIDSLVIDGVRTVGEVGVLHGKDGYLMVIDVSWEKLLELYLARKRESDDLSEEGYKRLYERENSGTSDGEMNINACKDLADVVIWNGGSKEALEGAVRETLWEIRRSKEGGWLLKSEGL